MALTKRQKEVVEFIAKFVDENGYSPSYDEIARGLNLASLATVHKHIKALGNQELALEIVQSEPFRGCCAEVPAGAAAASAAHS